MTRTQQRVIAALLVPAALVACSGGGGAAPVAPAPTSAVPAPGVPPVAGIEAEVVRLRTDLAAGGRVHVRLTLTGAEPVTVTSVALDSPAFTPLPPAGLTAQLAPGRTVDLPAAYGPVRCPAGEGVPAARLTLTRRGGAVEEVRVPLAGEVLAEIAAAECAVAGVLAVVRVDLAGLAPAGTGVRGDVVLSRTGSHEPRIAGTGPAGSVLLDLTTDGTEWVLEPGRAQLAIPVTVRVATCEPHVLAETKQPFVFPLRIAVGEEEQVPVRLPVDDAQRDLLWQLVDRTCAAVP